MISLLHYPLGRLRIAAFLEGCTFLAFGITMPLKYNYGIIIPNYILGMVHGILFISYILLLIQVSFKLKWKFSIIFWSFMASIIPFGTFVADAKIFSKVKE